MAIASSSGDYYEDDYNFVQNRPMQLTETDTKPSTTYEGADRIIADTGFEQAAAKTKQSVKPEGGRQEGIFTKILEHLGGEPVQAIKNLHDLVNAEMNHPIGMSISENPALADKTAKAAFDIGMVGMSSIPLKPGVGMFGGRMTKQSVQQAEKMEAEGFSAVSVKEMTGLERGAEGKWRKEFGDAEATFNPKGLMKLENDHLGKFEGGFLGSILNHEELYKVYPDARSITVIRLGKGKKIDTEGSNLPKGADPQAQFEPDKNVIYLSSNIPKGDEKAILIHEIQHWVQHKEGFSWAGAPELSIKDREDWAKTIFAQYPTYLKKIKELEAAGDPVGAGLVKEELIRRGQQRAYLSEAAEVEARNTEIRMDFSDKSRRSILAKETEDVPRGEQIVGGMDNAKVGSKY